MEEFYIDLPEIERKVFDMYKSNTNSFAYKLNDALRFNGDLRLFIADIKNLDRLIRKYQTPQEIILHRGTNLNQIQNFIFNNIFKPPAYLSCGTDLESIQKHFTNPIDPVYLKLNCPANTEMAPLESNVQFDGLENEMLLGRNHTFYIVNYEVIIDPARIKEIMSPFYALDVNQLHFYELDLVI